MSDVETFGRYLSQQRELRGLSIQDVIRETKLSPAAVSALESDRFESLPAKIFVIGYLRAYAACIGLNPDEVVLRYEEYVIARGGDGFPVEEPRRRPQTGGGGKWLVVSVIGAIGAIAYYWFTT